MRYVYVCFAWGDRSESFPYEVRAVYDTLLAADNWARAAAEALAKYPITKSAERHWPTGSEQYIYSDDDGELSGYIVMEVRSW